MEHWDELWPGGFRFRFDDNVFKPSTDTFLLGDFAEARRGERVCDLGAGIGLLGLLLLARQQQLHITNIDIDSAACALAEENAMSLACLLHPMVWRTALPCCGPTCGIGQLCQKPEASTCAWPIRPISRPTQDGWRREAGARPGPKPPAPLTSCVLRQRICSAAADGSAWSTGRNGRRS